MACILLFCKKLLLGCLAKQLHLLAVKGIRVYLSVYIQREGIGWSTRG
ncbi:hypothetical protein LINGRAHAP2_LOCUS32937 [Linum grandiflorum]